MKHPGIATILATGGPGMVTAAYSSGKPALGVGAGNAPAYVDKDVDIVRAANDLVLSKHFDYGMICATEQAIIADKDVYDPLVQELSAARPTSSPTRRRPSSSSTCSAAPPTRARPRSSTAWFRQVPALIANAAGFSIPRTPPSSAPSARKSARTSRWTMEKLCPVQAVLKSPDKETGFKMCEQMLVHGAGHTAVIHTNNQDLVREYGVRMHACRVFWNSPSSLGGVGDIYNAIAPSLTLGCGSYGGNSVSGNVQGREPHQTSSASLGGTTTCSGSRSRPRPTSSRRDQVPA